MKTLKKSFSILLVFLSFFSFACSSSKSSPSSGSSTTTTSTSNPDANNSQTNNPASTITNSIGIDFIYVESGTFQMGSNDGNSDQQPVHTVNIAKGFYIGKYEVTQGQWKSVMGTNPSYFSSCGDNCPVEQVSWNDIQTFITKLNEKEGINKYRLPTEAEWEYSARGGNKSKGYIYSGSNTIGDVAWCYDNSNDKTHQVGTKQANELGIYDMSGNLREWVQDYYGIYSSSTVNDPLVVNGSYMVLRGGAWYSSYSNCRVAYRTNHNPVDRLNNTGFRLAKTL